MTIAVAMALLISPILATPSTATSTLDQSTAVSGSAGLSAASDSTTFIYVTTAAQIYVVPSGVTQLTIQARGGDGAGASAGVEGGRPAFQSCGGAGALVTTVVDVNPGETLNIYVAGRGIHGTGDRSGSTGGWGYGSGGTGDGYGGGGGGGAPAVILSGAPLVVAGGGGGAGRISGAFGGAAGVSSAGAGDSGGNSGAGAGADGSGAGATGTRAGGSWGTGAPEVPAALEEVFRTIQAPEEVAVATAAEREGRISAMSPAVGAVGAARWARVHQPQLPRPYMEVLVSRE
jgi:hypothetical protein